MKLRFSALLLAILLAGATLTACGTEQPDLPDTEPATETATETEPATEAATETEPATEAATETEPATEAATETEPATEAATETEPATEAATETEPATEAVTETEPTTEAPKGEQPMSENIILAKRGEESPFTIVLNRRDTDTQKAYSSQIANMVAYTLGVEMSVIDGTALNEGSHELILFSSYRDACKTLTASLEKDEYAIQTIVNPETGTEQVILAANGNFARLCAVDRLIKEYLTDDGFVLPADLDVRGTCTEEDAILTLKRNMNGIRDPFILYEDGKYYAYGTGWVCYSTSKLDGVWKPHGTVVKIPSDSNGNHWAPEVHKVGDKYYMFTTYLSKTTGHRGCAVFIADKPTGPFTLHSDGHFTPKDWDAIDASLYIDEEGKPWVVFVHEWTSMPNKVGAMVVSRMTDDLTAMEGKYRQIFSARDPKWAKNGVTDGCFIYRMADGGLRMLWSNWDKAGYCVAMVRNDSAIIDKPQEWVQEDAALLYSKDLTGTLDGGHGMIFTAEDGQMYLSLHSPNTATAENPTYPRLIPIYEAHGTLLWDLWDGEEK